MKRRAWWWTRGLVLALVLLGAPVLAGDDDEARVDRLDHKPGEILIKFKKKAGAGGVLAAAKQVRASHAQSFTRFGIRRWRLGPGVDLEKALEILNRRGDVEWAEPNYFFHAHGVPDDPDLIELWGLRNAGQSGGVPDADIDADEAWDAGHTDASSIIVGVIDTGIDYGHEDLAANMWTNDLEANGTVDQDDGDQNSIVDDIHGANFIGDGPPTGDPMDDNGHGSHTAGTIGAVGDNGTGVVGVCWKVQLMALKFLDAGGSGSTDDAIEALQYALEMGAHITSNSWGGGRRSSALETAIASSNALFVASAGNDGNSRKNYPAGYDLDNVIAVAATDAEDQLASFSTYGSWVHLAAPGVDTYSCLQGDRYGFKSGTSMACPHVSGAAALLMASGHSISSAKATLLSSVDVLPNLDGAVASGGRLNVYRALTGSEPRTLVDDTSPAAVASITVGTPGPYGVGLSWTAVTDYDDDGNGGPATYYDLRFHTATIVTEADWEAAKRARGEPAPATPGTTETFTLDRLDPETEYWVGLEVFDAAGNGSGRTVAGPFTTAAGPWAIDVLAEGNVYYKDADYDPFNQRWGCAYSVGDAVWVAIYEDGTWTHELVEASRVAGPGIDFAFAPDGTPSVSYGWGKIRFAWRSANGTWNTEDVENGKANNDYTSLTYDQGEPTIAYRKGDNLQYARKVGGLTGTWVAETVERAPARYQDLVYVADPDDPNATIPFIAYSDDPDNDGWFSMLKVAWKRGGAWYVHEFPIDPDTDNRGLGVYATIAANADGELFVADAAYSNIRLIRGRYDSTIGTWDWDDPESVGIGNGIELVCDPDTKGPVIAATTGGIASLWIEDGAGGWTQELVDPRGGGYVDIVNGDATNKYGMTYRKTSGALAFARKLPAQP